MEKSNYSTFKTRRILVILYLVTFLAAWLLMYVYARSNTSLMLSMVFVIMIINGVVELYLKSISDVFKISNKKIRLDERLSLVRIKAQRNAYFIILIVSMLMLPIGYQFYKNDAFNYTINTLIFIGLLIFYLPTLIIAWQEKEV